jgi:hypothetical protein
LGFSGSFAPKRGCLFRSRFAWIVSLEFLGLIPSSNFRTETFSGGSAINLGTMKCISVIDAAGEVLRHTGYTARIELHPQMQTGPYNRFADNFLAKKLPGWEPTVMFNDGLRQTIDWYFGAKKREDISSARSMH